MTASLAPDCGRGKKGAQSSEACRPRQALPPSRRVEPAAEPLAESPGAAPSRAQPDSARVAVSVWEQTRRRVLSAPFTRRVRLGVLAGALGLCLLIGIGTRGKAPFRDVLTHGFVVDEKGNIVSPSLLTALIAERELAKHPGSSIIHNLITSWTVPEVVRENGGTPLAIE